MKKLMTAAAMMLAATAAAAATEVIVIRGSSNSECVVFDPTGTPLNVRSRPNGPIIGAQITSEKAAANTLLRECRRFDAAADVGLLAQRPNRNSAAAGRER